MVEPDAVMRRVGEGIELSQRGERESAQQLPRYRGADEVKLGYTDDAGKTFVASATRNGHRVYVSLMHSADIGAPAELGLEKLHLVTAMRLLRGEQTR